MKSERVLCFIVVMSMLVIAGISMAYGLSKVDFGRASQVIVFDKRDIENLKEAWSSRVYPDADINACGETVGSIEEVRVEKVIEKVEETPEPKKHGWVLLGEFKLTAYCSCSKCCGKYGENRPVGDNGELLVSTASGTYAKEGRTVAVDTRVIPWGTHMLINGHEYVAEDMGSSIKGWIADIYIEDHDRCVQFGVQYADVYIWVD